ncbi:MAG: glycosyltransferase family A protein [Anaerolineales bacterium]
MPQSGWSQEETTTTLRRFPVVPRKYPFQIALSYVLAVYFNQSDASSLYELLRLYSTYSPDLLDRIEFVIVDDGSTVPIAIREDLNLNLVLLRIGIDIPWNEPGARNLGVLQANADKILLTDLDYEVPEHTLRKTLSLRPLGRRIYKIRLMTLDGKISRPHPNTYVLSRGHFLKLFGLDEEFSGSYGFHDSMFFRWQRNCGTRFLKLRKKYFKRDRRIDLSHSYHDLTRDLEHNREVDRRKRAELASYGPGGGHSRKMLRFPWHVVLERERVPSGLPRRRPYWARLWFLRWLFAFSI